MNAAFESYDYLFRSKTLFSQILKILELNVI